MPTEREKAVSAAIDTFKARIKSSSLLTQISLRSLKPRLNNILDTKYGAELYDLGLLPLQPLACASSIDEIKNIIDAYLEATRFYERHYSTMYALFREQWFKTAIKNGDIHYWNELTGKKIEFKKLTRQQSGIFVRDSLAHVEASDTVQKPKKAANSK